MTVFFKLFLIFVVIMLALFIYKFIILKIAIHKFIEEMEKHKDTEYAQAIKVITFDKDVVQLAVKFTELVDLQHKMNDTIDENSKHLGNVISGMAHDFRTPITVTLGYLQMIEKSNELSEKNMRYLKIALNKTKYLIKLSDDLFNFTKQENLNDEFEILEINLSNMVIENILEQNNWIEERGVATEFSIDDKILIKANLHNLTRIMNNVFSNAQKYTVSILGVALSIKNNHPTLRIYNDIANVKELDCHKVFEPFYRLDSRNENGTGLGLYVVDSLAKKNNINVEALINENGYFEIRLVF